MATLVERTSNVAREVLVLHTTDAMDAMEAAITCTAQTNYTDGAEIEGDFFSYCDNLIDERDDLCY